MGTDTTDPLQAALETAEELRADLEVIAASDLPFSHDAEQILKALENSQNK